ncbi:MAG TPA: response regulator [Verrucomicrobiae bacterium]|jgi:CheY-like chemotaxis protein|nr:response regulator [Verrucomicrobiae bacterium]
MKRVLITEDDGLIAAIYRDSFEKEGFSAEVAPDGAIAIQRLKGNPPDVVVLDLMLPNVNGVEVLKYIRSQQRLEALPVIVMSNAFAGALGKEATAAGATKIFAKNACGPKRLMKEVRDLLAATAFAPAEMAVSNDTAFILKDFRKEVSIAMPVRVAAVRRLVEGLAGDHSNAERLLALHRAVHQLASIVSLAGFSATAHLTGALDAMIKELHSKPQMMSPSSLRTIVDALRILDSLSTRSAPQLGDGIPSPLILVVDDDEASRKSTCAALEQAHLRALAVGEPQLALNLAADNRFNLLLTDVGMPDMNGFELCKKFHATSTNADTPVIFVASLNEFEVQAGPASRSSLNFIAKPILAPELAVKALTDLLRESA